VFKSGGFEEFKIKQAYACKRKKKGMKGNQKIFVQSLTISLNYQKALQTPMEDKTYMIEP
jgi:hypothetical protein